MSAIIPFAEWLGLARSLRNHPRAVAVLEAYFDESGTSGKEPLTVVSGFIATDMTWLDFDALWRSALKNDLKELGLDWFHMVECENGTERFSKWLLEPEVRRRAATTMANVIVKSGLTGFWSSVDVEDWRGPLADQTIKNRYQRPYHFCFEDCIRQAEKWVSEFAPVEMVDLIFAEQQEYKKRAQIIYNAYMAGKAKSPLKSLRFAPMQTCAPLQAADMAVYSTNKSMMGDLYGKDTRHRIYRSALDVLFWNEGSFTGGHHDALSFLSGSD